jgi:hypothetical protein
MKTKVTLLASLLLFAVCAFAQTKPELKTEKIKVWGNCDMCKAKIEKAAKAAGASSAVWNDESKILTVKFASNKTNNEKIEKKVAAAGYDTQNETAPADAYENLPGCCHYDRKADEKKAEEKKS